MNKTLLLISGALIVGYVLVRIGTGNKLQVTARKDNRLLLTASFYPLAYIAGRIGGENIAVTDLTPAGIEPHEYEPSTRSVANLDKQDVILLNGGGLEGYTDKIKENIDPEKTTIAVIGQPLMAGADPHVWLDPNLYRVEAREVKDILIRKDPKNEKQYIANFTRFDAELVRLDNEFKTGLKNCRKKDIITSHNAFGYLAKRYGLHQIAIAGLSPDQEPSPKTLVETAQYAKSKNIGYIFFEELVSPKIAETLASEIGAKTLVFNPLEGLTKNEISHKEDYISIQRRNLSNLQIALECN